MVVEASGSEAGINTAIDIVRKCGRISVVGMTGKDRVNIAWDKLIHKVCDVAFNLSSSYTSWPRALSIMKNTAYDLTKIITHQENISNWEKVIEDIQSGKAIKAMFIPE